MDMFWDMQANIMRWKKKAEYKRKRKDQEKWSLILVKEEKKKKKSTNQWIKKRVLSDWQRK